MRIIKQLLTMLAVVMGTTAAAQTRGGTAGGTVALDPDPAATATEAYVFGYPLVSMWMSKRVMTNVVRPEKGRAPIDQVAALYAYPTAEYKDVVAPNVNTLYNAFWLDLSKGPIVVRQPDTHGRYYVMEVLDMWTNVISSPGSRTTGTAPQNIAITGPGWTGTAPGGITTTVRSPTNVVWVINRIQANGPTDYAVVNALQRQITTMPLTSFGRPHSWPPGTVDPSIDMKTSVLEQVNRMSGAQFFTAMAMAMKENRPVPQDAPIVARMAHIGLVPGSDFRPDPALAGAIEAGAKAGMAKMMSSVATVARVQNGWAEIVDCGEYGTKYLTRAIVALKGLGCNLPEDAIYGMATTDATGQKLDGSSSYVVHFLPGQLPPVKAFWSITMYDQNNFLVANPLDRSAISSWMPLEKNEDGSVDLYMQHASPGASKEANWLPAPPGDFVLMLRMYWPEQAVISGAWKPPAVQRVQ